MIILSVRLCKASATILASASNLLSRTAQVIDIKVINTTEGKRAQRLPKAERRRLLVRSALRVFARNGFGNAGHAQVAKDAGVSTPTVFLYLPNRQALVDAVLEEVDRYFGDFIARAIESEQRAAPRLLAIARAYVDAIDGSPDHVQVFLNWGTVTHDETWPQYAAFQDRILSIFETIIQDGIDRGELPAAADPVLGAHLVMGSANMIAQMKFRGRTRDEIEAFISALIRGALLGRA